MFNAAKMPNAGSSIPANGEALRAVATYRGNRSGGDLWTYCSRKLVAIKIKNLEIESR
jgi:hypothetical protein